MLKATLLSCFLLYTFLLPAQEYRYNYTLFTNSAMPGNYFFSNTSVKGNSFIKNENKKLPVSTAIVHTPGNTLLLQYKNAPGGNWWASINVQRKRGIDHFKNANFLSFWVYNASDNATAADLPLVRLLKTNDSLTNTFTIAPATASRWQRVIIPVAAMDSIDPGKPDDIAEIIFSQPQNASGNEYKIYIDDIEFLQTDNAPSITAVPLITAAKGYAKHVDIVWNTVNDSNVHFVKIYRSPDGINYTPVGVQQPFTNRYADYTGETGKRYFYKISFLNDNYEETKPSQALETATRSMADDELLSMVQEASFRYYWDGAETYSGLAKENIPGRHSMIASGASGFGVMALITGAARKFITRKEAVDRFVKIVNFLEKAETFHGAYPHFIDGASGKVEPFFGTRDNGADLVETSFLMQGLLAARQYFSGNDPDEKLIRYKINSIWQKVEWSWFRQRPNSLFLYWHWSPDQAWVINHNLIGWNETMVTYLLAIASPTYPVPPNMYYSGWANQGKTGQQYRSGWGGTRDGSMYSNGKTYYGVKLDVGVSNGGPLFFTHYSYLGYDPHFITDKYTNYFTNNKNIATINYKYCVANPNHYKAYGDSAWGLTASDGPFNYSADEPVKTRDYAKLAPTGAISSFPYLPKEAMKALKNYYYNYGSFLWGEYGFKDAFDLTNNWCSEIYMGLNQAPMTVMIENYRTGLIWKLFMSSPEIKEGLKKLEALKK
ncbi:MAG: glucoamylase family protein [Ferruginibacter sp.]